VAAAQSIPPDEIHSQTGPYVPPSRPTLRTEVRVVEIPIVVRDARHQAVPGLTREDFKIFDEGKRQEITSFSVENFSPRVDGAAGAGPKIPGGAAPPKTETGFRYLALCFDDVHLAPEAFRPVTEAAAQFVKTGLTPGDRVAVITTSHTQDYAFTGELPALIGELERLRALPEKAAANPTRCPVIRPYEAYQIANGLDPGNVLMQSKLAECQACYNNPCHEGEVMGKAEEVWIRTRTDTDVTLRVVEALVDGMAKLPGQRLILLTSSGFLAGEQEVKLDRLIDKARAAGVVINALDAKGLTFGFAGSMAYDGAAILASGTGGEYLHGNDLTQGLRQLAAAPETVYLTGFTPRAEPDGKFHRLKVQLTDGNKYSIQSRLGYVASKLEAPAAYSVSDKLDQEVLASNTLADVPISFNWQQWAGPPGITMIIHLDFSRMHFRQWNGRRIQKLTIVAALLDGQGNVVAGRKSELQIAFRDATFNRFTKTGFTTAVTIKAPPGHYLARGAAQEAMEGKIAAGGAGVDIK